MITVYFDTTVYSHIDKGWIGKEVVDMLRGTLLTAKLTARLSVTNIEELYFPRKNGHRVSVLFSV